MSQRTSRTLAIGFAGLGLVGALAGCSTGTSSTGSTGSSGSDTSSSDSSSSAASSAASSPATADNAASGSFKDGTYTEDGGYVSPAGAQTVTVRVTLASNKITAVTVTPHATDPTAKGYQAQFVSGISAEVVGKDIDKLNVSRVAGSSLTSGGFNKAIKAIEADAKA
jgi:uncharacterized protein with FMN-binding domain